MVFLVVLDQMIVSGSRFLISIVLAKLLGLEEFGVYVLLWTVVTFAAGMQIPITITPMMQLGAGVSDRRSGIFFTVSLGFQLFYHLAAIPFVSAGAIWILWGRADIWLLTLAVNAYVICYNQYEFFRRFFYTTGQRWRVLFCDIALYLTLALAISAFVTNAEVSIVAYLLISIIPALALCFLVLRSFPKNRVSKIHALAHGKKMMRIAVPLMISALGSFVSGHTFIYATALFLGHAEVGGIAAARNLLGPLIILLMALENGITRESVQRYLKDPESLQAFLKRVTVMWLTVFFLYVVLTSTFSESILSAIYGEDFRQFHSLVLWFGLASLMQLISRVQAVRLRTVGDYQVIKAANLTSMWVSLALAMPLVYGLGLSGAMLSLIIQQFIVMFFQILPLRMDSRLNIFPVGLRREGKT